MSCDFRIVIPARYASSRLPGKPLALLAGKPMLTYVYEQALKSEASEVVIATDDERIYRLAEELGAKVCMTSNLHRSGTDRIAEVAQQLAWPDETLVVNLQGDEPLTPPEILNQVALNLHQHPQAGIATLCWPIHSASELHDPHVVKVVRDRQDYALYFSRAPIPWERDALELESTSVNTAFRHIGLYAYRVGFLHAYRDMELCELEQLESLEQLRALWNGVKIHCGESLLVPGHGIDTEADLRQVEALLAVGKNPIDSEVSST
ncbi:MAG: 3-deoxy-manno-octulosonate cytidylyltransferase [Gammaproteobacteria bacterium]|nr:3-deoxy-manno-octulosonate cytidylyltransferase [Gammaproteobacteria bacterium]